MCLQVLSQRTSFLYNAVVDFREHVHTSGQDAITVDMLALSVGLPCNVDPALCNALQAEKECKYLFVLLLVEINTHTLCF